MIDHLEVSVNGVPQDLSRFSPQFSVIWLHGLGADGHDFAPIASRLIPAGGPEVRFIFPHAPSRPVTLNGGYVMPAWFDMVAIDANGMQDREGLEQTAAAVRELIARENERGIASDRIILAGFSQGGAASLYIGLTHPDSLLGIIVLSTYIPLEGAGQIGRAEANKKTPILYFHGARDPLIALPLAEASQRLLKGYGNPLNWKIYDMEHEVIAEEIADIAAWMGERMQEASS